MNRKQFKENLNAVNIAYQDLRLEFERRKVPVIYLERLNSIHRKHLENLNEQLQDDLIKLNQGKGIKIN